ncbi:MAG: hypothetical protein RMM29_05920 [Planctomycetota bacterium]|nr:hypothetical protein [Planctomycetota bacterium]MCX8039790.1 hypothetical protein [Planctomycetota bacterium]MDW8373169.1 hypothetical protein [Planctomycetota bacterium]
MSIAGGLSAAVGLPALAALLLADLLPRPDAVRQGALASLVPSALASGIIACALRSARATGSLFVAVGAGLLVRLLGIAALAYAALLTAGQDQWLPFFASGAACLIASFIVETIVVYRHLSRGEGPRG